MTKNRNWRKSLMPVSNRAAAFADRMGFSRGRKITANRVAVVMPPVRRHKAYGQGGPEIKFLDTLLTQTANLVGSVTSMSTLAQGLTNITRIGNKIDIKSVEVQGTVIAGPGAAAAAIHKWAIVLDKEPEAAAIAGYNDVYANAAGGVPTPLSFMNVNQSSRFVVLATGVVKTGSLFNAPIVAVSPDIQDVKEFRKCDINSKYLLGTAAQNAQGSNQILFCLISSNTDADITLDWNLRIRYTDE